jgi:hypothetical protein
MLSLLGSKKTGADIGKGPIKPGPGPKIRITPPDLPYIGFIPDPPIKGRLPLPGTIGIKPFPDIRGRIPEGPLRKGGDKPPLPLPDVLPIDYLPLLVSTKIETPPEQRIITKDEPILDLKGVIEPDAPGVTQGDFTAILTATYANETVSLSVSVTGNYAEPLEYRYTIGGQSRTSNKSNETFSNVTPGTIYPTVRVIDALGFADSNSTSIVVPVPVSQDVYVYAIWQYFYNGRTVLTKDKGYLSQLKARSTINIGGQTYNRSLRYFTNESDRDATFKQLQEYFNP